MDLNDKVVRKSKAKFDDTLHLPISVQGSREGQKLTQKSTDGPEEHILVIWET